MTEEKIPEDFIGWEEYKKEEYISIRPIVLIPKELFKEYVKATKIIPKKALWLYLVKKYLKKAINELLKGE